MNRGRVQSVSCLHLLDDCWPIERISRIVAPGASGGSRALAWLYGDDGNVVVRSTGMPPGSLRIRLRGGSEDTAIPFEDIVEVMFAVRKR